MDLDEIENMLRRLRLPRIRHVFREKLQAAAVEGVSLADLLGNLLEDELSSRDESQLRSRVRRAAFPFNKHSSNSISADIPSCVGRLSRATWIPAL